MWHNDTDIRQETLWARWTLTEADSPSANNVTCSRMAHAVTRPIQYELVRERERELELFNLRLTVTTWHWHWSSSHADCLIRATALRSLRPHRGVMNIVCKCGQWRASNLHWTIGQSASTTIIQSHGTYVVSTEFHEDKTRFLRVHKRPSPSGLPTKLLSASPICLKCTSGTEQLIFFSWQL
jgi:hypothetical protein